MTVKENESQSVDYRPLIGLLIAVAAVLAIIGLAQMSRNNRAAQGGVQGQLVG